MKPVTSALTCPELSGAVQWAVYGGHGGHGDGARAASARSSSVVCRVERPTAGAPSRSAAPGPVMISGTAVVAHSRPAMSRLS